MTEYIEREAACSSMPDDYYGWRDKQLLKSVPSTDVQPVRHGRYITDDMGDSSCSECGERYLDVTQNYCPNCGAKMDGADKTGAEATE